jgi:NitT/TauT family transport system substrate-binding protein
MSSRRKFLRDVSIAGAAGALGLGREVWAAEPPPETTRLRLGRLSSLCVSPQYVAHELLLAEGFREIEYIGDQLSSSGVQGARAMGAGQIDVSMNFAAPLVLGLDENLPIMLLGGVHAGCFELFGTEAIRSIGDLKGRAVAIPGRGSIGHIFLASIATSVGIDPDKDIRWAIHPAAEAKALLAAGKIDALLAFPPDPQELRSKRIGRVVLNTALDRPWSQYFCCMVAANREFARKHPAATKRALRAILKASDLCASDPARAVSAYTKFAAYAANAEHALQAIRELPYGKWRDYNPEETVRFYALRLREAGMVKSAPQKLIAQGTDWRFLNELKKELKA